MVNTLVHDRKVRNRKQAEEYAAKRRAEMYSKACLAVKSHPRVGAEAMSYRQRVQLLQEYVEILEDHLAEFRVRYPDSDGRTAAVKIKRERGYALTEMATLLVSIARGDEPLRVPK